jgi:hypothetical protein
MTATKATETAPEFVAVGENVRYSVEGDKLVIEIDTEHRGALSVSGKTVRVASTLGNQKIDGTPLIFGLNIYVKP